MTTNTSDPELSVQTLDGARRGFEFEHDWDSDTALSTALITTVESISDGSTFDTPPLFESIDPDSLDSLFADLRDGTPRASGELSFPFAGYEVTVYADGTVRLRERSENGRF